MTKPEESFPKVNFYSIDCDNCGGKYDSDPIEGDSEIGKEVECPNCGMPCILEDFATKRGYKLIGGPMTGDEFGNAMKKLLEDS